MNFSWSDSRVCNRLRGERLLAHRLETRRHCDFNFESPAGGSVSAGWTWTGLGHNGTYFLGGDYTNGRIVLIDINPAARTATYVSAITLGGSAPPTTVQGVSYRASSGTYWVCHFAGAGGSVREYDGSGNRLTTYDLSAVGAGGPNNSWYDAVNDRLLTTWDDNKIRGIKLSDGSIAETITISGGISNRPDGIVGDYIDSVTYLWCSFDGTSGSVTAPSSVAKITRATGAVVSGSVKIVPTGVEGMWMTDATTLYMACDQGFHYSIPNGNRCWELDITTGAEKNVDPVAGSVNFTITASGQQYISGLGFSPKFMIHQGSQTSDGAGADVSIGFSDNNLNGAIQSSFGSDSDATADCAMASGYGSGTGQAYISTKMSGASAVDGGSFKVFSATHDGFMIDATHTGIDRRISTTAFAGDDVLGYVGSGVLSTSGSDQTFSGITDGNAAFTPIAVVMLAGVTDSGSGGFFANVDRFGIGVMTASAQWAIANTAMPGGSADTQGVARTDSVAIQIDGSLGYVARTTYSAFGSGSFTVSKPTPGPFSSLIRYLAIGGAKVTAFAGSDTQPNATTGNQSLAYGGRPNVSLFFSAGRAANNTPTTNYRVAMGSALSSSNRSSRISNEKETGGATDTAHALDETKCLKFIADGDETTVLASADFVSNDSGGSTINWTTCDAVQRQFHWLSIGLAAASPPPIATYTMPKPFLAM